jgi:cyclomaltodextrinase / maltogenic alpha-amylase / neopullulanase
MMTTITTPEWVKDAIFYQIFPDRFAKSERIDRQNLKLETWESAPTPQGFKGGDLYGVLEKLDYLQDLGITAIYLNPIFSSASNHRYHTYDYFKVDPLLGGNQALKELLDESHKRGMRIVLDGVFNHASRGFWQFHHVLENGAGSPYVDWFHYDPDRLYGRKPWGAYPDTKEIKDLQSGKGSLEAIGYQAWWDLPALPKFNTETAAVRSFIYDVSEYWLKFGIDGWRLDVPAEINDDSFWIEFRHRVKEINPEAYIVGEIWHESKRWLQGDQFDAVMNYPVTIADLGFFCGTYLDIQEASKAGGFRNQIKHFSAEEFADEIETILGWYDPAITQVQLNLLDSHDTPRFITCASGDIDSLKLAYLFMFTYPGAPCIYYGDEVGMEGRQDPECRKSFIWDQSAWDMDLLNYTKSLTALRRSHPALRRGEYRRLYAMDNIYAFSRSLDHQNYGIVLNPSETRKKITLPIEAYDRTVKSIWGNAEIAPSEDILFIELEARAGVVLSY